MSTDRRGSNVVEFAMLFPLYLAFIAGIVDYGWLTYQKSAVVAAAQEGCRTASLVDPGLNEVNIDEVFAVANEQMEAKLVAKGLTCEDDCTQVTIAIGTHPNRALSCDLTVPFSAITGLVPTPDTLTARAVVRLEFQRN